jgi:filamentous hemagglutinin
MEMHGAMDNGHLSVKGFSSDQLQHLPTHGTLTEVLEKRASQVAQLTGTSPKQSLNVLDRTTLESLAHYRSVLKTRELVAEFKDIYHSAVNLGKEYISKGFGYLKDGYRFLTKIHGKKITVNEENYDWCGEHGCYRLDDYDRELVGNMWLLSKNGKTDQEAAQATEAFNEALANGDLVLESHHGNVDIYAEQARAAREGYNLWTGEEISEEMANLTIITSVGGTLTGMFYAGRGFNRVPTRNLNLPTPPQKNKNSNNNVNTNINSNQNNNVNSPGAPYRNPNANNSGDIWNVNKSSAKNITLYTNYKEVLKVTQTANPLIDSLRQTGRLPSNYINKEVAIANGWKPGKALNNYVPGGQLGGDVFKNTTNVLPNAPGRVWYEADVGLVNTMSRSKQPGSRLLYSNDGQIYITTDHYKTIHYIGTY